MPDLNQLLETLLRGLEAGEVTNLFLWLLLAIFVFAIVSKWFGWLPRFTAYAPAFLTSLGIFGTFVGIVIGLLDFDPNQIDKSIGDLLEGLKTAFVSSIAGLGSGLFFKFLTLTSLFPESEEGDKETQSILDALNKQTQLLKATQGAIAGDEGASLIRQVMLLREEHRHAHAEQTKLFEATQETIAGTEESSLVGQVRLLREDHKTAHEEFTDQLWRKFAEQTQLLEATQNAIAAADESSLTGQVMLWREEHRHAHEEFANRLWKKLDEFAEIMSRSATEQVIEALQKVITDFNQNLTEQFGDNFKELNAAVEKLVEWQENYRKQLEQLHKLYEESTAAIILIEQQCALIPQSMKQLEPIIGTASHQMGKIESTIETVNNQMGNFAPIIKTANRQIAELEKQSAELEKHLAAFAEMRDQATEAIPEVSKFSDEMHEAVSKTIQEMGTHLGQISLKFAKDYEELTEAMADVIERVKAFNQRRGDNR